MVIIGMYKLLSNSDLYEHRCLENIKKLYKSAGKCDDQNQQKEIIEAAMVSNTEGFTDNSPISSGSYVTVKQPNTWKTLCQFSETLDIKPNTAVCRLCAAK